MENIEDFNIIFHQYSPLILMIATRFSRTSMVPLAELISQLNEELWISYQKYNPDRGAKMETWFNTRLRDRAKRVVGRKEGSYYRRVYNYDPTPGATQESEENAPTFDFTLEESKIRGSTEDIVIKKQKRTSQRQLTDSIKESAKIQLDPLMTAIIKGIENGENPYSIAKSLGLKRNTVDRKIRRLAKSYDKTVHGDIVDIFPDGLKIKREYLSA